MNEKKIIDYLMMRTIKQADKGIDLIDGPETFEMVELKVLFKNIRYYAKMIIEDEDGD